MRKSTIITAVILSALLLGACVYGYFTLFRNPAEEKPRNTTYAIVPLDAVLVEHFSRFGTLGSEVLNDGGYVATLLTGDGNLAVFFGQLYDFFEKKYPLLKDAEALCSVHVSAKNTLSVLFGMSVSGYEDTAWWNEFIAEGRIPATTRIYDGEKIFSLYGGLNPVQVVFVNGFLIASASPVILEASVRHLVKGSSLLDNAQFAKVVEQAVMAKPSRIFIAHSQIPQLFAAYMGRPLQKYAAFCRTTAGWTALDGVCDTTGLRMDGYTFLGQGHREFFSVFSGQEPQKQMAFDIFPANTVAGITLGLSDVQAYLDNYAEYLDVNRKKRNMPSAERVAWFTLLYPTEVAAGWVPFRGRMEWLGVIHSRYINQAKIQYALLNKQVEGAVMKHPLPGILGELFGDVFRVCEASHYCYQGSYILLGAEDLLSDIKQRNEAGNYHSLSANMKQTPAGNHVMDASNLTVFLQPTQGIDSLMTLMDKRYAPRLDSLRPFNAQYYFLQFSAMSERIYTHALIYGDKLETSPLLPRPRPVKFKNTVARDSLQRAVPPYKIQNHFTKRQNLLFQTPWPECKLVLKDHTDKVLWEKTMEGSIQDRVEQIDFLKNQKLQMLFAVGNRLYLLDRLGNPVSPYPKSYGQSILYGPFVFDPQSGKDYRIFLVHRDETLRCYNKLGNPFPGWTDFTLPDYLTGTPRMLVIERVPYWVIYTNSQTVFLSGNGETVALTSLGESLQPNAELEILGPGQVRGTTIEGNTLTINLN